MLSFVNRWDGHSHVLAAVCLTMQVQSNGAWFSNLQVVCTGLGS